jgi:hypothetical protein
MTRPNRDQMCPEAAPPESSTLKRVGWMALIWAASIAVLGVVSLALRWWLK